MKKYLLLSLLTLGALFAPIFVTHALEPDSIGAGDFCTQNYLCTCSYPAPFASATLVTSSSEGCQAACVETYHMLAGEGASLQGGSWLFQCDNADSTTAVNDSGPLVDVVAAPIKVPVKDPILPNLNVKIPGLCDATGVCWKGITNDITGGNYQSNLLGTYIKAVYAYLLIAASIIAVTMLMIAGIQYATARGDSHQVETAKKRIGNAVTGVILLLLAYNIAFLIDPSTTTFNSLSLDTVAIIALNTSVAGADGAAIIQGGAGPYTNLSSPYLDAVKEAKKSGLCQVTEGFGSPIGPATPGVLPNQGPHHWIDKGANLDYTKIDALDWAAAWGAQILAPFSGTVTNEAGTDPDDACGNKIRLSNSSTAITICHVKDFTNTAGLLVVGQVTQGDVIGHVGGLCCTGSNPPKGSVTACNVSGTVCGDPKTGGACECQTIAQAGNTTGPHVHVTMTAGVSNLLACLK